MHLDFTAAQFGLTHQIELTEAARQAVKLPASCPLVRPVEGRPLFGMMCTEETSPFSEVIHEQSGETLNDLCHLARSPPSDNYMQQNKLPGSFMPEGMRCFEGAPEDPMFAIICSDVLMQQLEARELRHKESGSAFLPWCVRAHYRKFLRASLVLQLSAKQSVR